MTTCIASRVHIWKHLSEFRNDAIKYFSRSFLYNFFVALLLFLFLNELVVNFYGWFFRHTHKICVCACECTHITAGCSCCWTQNFTCFIWLLCHLVIISNCCPKTLNITELPVDNVPRTIATHAKVLLLRPQRSFKMYTLFLHFTT